MPNVFSLFGSLKVDTNHFEKSLLDIDNKLHATTRNVSTLEKQTKSYGNSTAVTARQQEKIRESVAKIRSVTHDATAAFHRGEISLRRLAGAYAQADTRIASLNSRLKDQAARLHDAANKGSGLFGNLTKSVTVANLASNAIGQMTAAMTDGARSIFDYTSNLEQTKVAFTSLMKNSTAAATHIQDLQKLSRSTPLQFESISKMSARLQGAGIEAKKLIPLIKDIGNVAAATGDLSAERMEGLSTALSQIASKGRVSAEEMEQMAERGVPAWRILSEAMGKTAEQTRKMAKDGEISSQQLFDAFQKFSRANFGDAMAKQANTFSGSMKQIENVALQTANKAFQPLYDEISKISSKIARSLREQEAEGKQSGVSFGFAVGEAIGDGMARGVKSKTGRLDILGGLYDSTIGAAAELGRNIGKGAHKAFWGAFDPVTQEMLGFEKAQERYKQEMQRFHDEMARLQRNRSGVTDPASQGKPNVIKVPGKNLTAEFAESAKRWTEREMSAAMRVAENSLKEAEETFASFLDKSGDTVQSWWGISTSSLSDVTKHAKVYADSINSAHKALVTLQNAQRTGMTPSEDSELTQKQQQIQKSINEGMNRATSGFIDRAKAAKVELESLHQKVAEFYTRQNFGEGLMEKFGESISSNIDRLNAEWDDLRTKMGEPPDLNVWENFWTNLRTRLEEFKASLPSIKEALGENLMNTLDGIGDVLGNAVAQWDGTLKGFWESLKQGFRQLIGDLISQLIRLMAYKLILNLVGGIGGGASSGPGIGDSLGAAFPGGYADGGFVRGPGTSTSDSIAARLSKGEYVNDAKTVKFFGPDFFAGLKHMAQKGTQPFQDAFKFASGGLVNAHPPMAFVGGGYVGGFASGSTSTSNSTVTNSNTFNITVQGGGSREQNMQTGDQIAREVIARLRKLDQRSR